MEVLATGQKIGLYTNRVDGIWFGAACNGEQVYATSFSIEEKGALSSLLDCLPFDVEFEVFATPSAFAERVFRSVKTVYDGKGESEKLSLATEWVSPFNRRVLEVARLIPVGYTASYGSVSKAAGGSPRAVGGVMATNPFAPIVPCHRVVRSDCTLGGFGGGIELKAQMLTREKRGNGSPKDVPVGDKVLRVFPVEFVLEKPCSRKDAHC